MNAAPTIRATLALLTGAPAAAQSVRIDPGNVVYVSRGGTVYFASSAWVTSDAIHAVDAASGRERYVCPGNGFEGVMAGEYRGGLAVSQHRYFIGSGSYDWYRLVAPSGRTIGPLGEEMDGFHELLEDETARPGSRRPCATAPAPASRDRR
jgi:hypothetical protein